MTVRNPYSAWLADKFDHLEKPAFSCEYGEAERTAYAIALKTRIKELHLKLGIRFPIYLIVTHCDRLAGFNAFFDDLEHEQRSQVWGLTFPVLDSNRIDATLATFPAEFESLIRQLQAHMFDRILEQSDVSRRAAIYNFPQQFGALGEPLARFLVDVFGASPYAPNALLRGVYFTSAVQSGIAHVQSASSLTAALRAIVPSESSKKVAGPGYFITQLFRELIFRESGLAGTRLKLARRRVMLQRWAIVMILFFGAMLGTGMLLGYERAWEHIAAKKRSANELAKLARDGITIDQPQSMLPLLDAARDQAVNLNESAMYDVYVPILFLYQPRLHMAAEVQYRSLLQQTIQPFLVNRTNKAMQDDKLDLLKRYRALRAYLMLGDKVHFKADSVLAWAKDDMRDLALTNQQRTDLLAHLRILLDPEMFAFDEQPDLKLVTQTRGILLEQPFGVHIYQSIYLRLKESMPDSLSVLQMAGINAPLVLHRKSGQPLIDGVPNIYTLAGYQRYAQLRDADLSNVDENIWVMGKNNVQNKREEIAELKTSLDKMYFDQYIAAWDAVIDDVELLPLPRKSGSAEIVKLLAESDSPLRLFLQAAAAQTTLGNVKTTGEKNVTVSSDGIDKMTEKVRGILRKTPTKQTETPALNAAGSSSTSVDRHFDALHRLMTRPSDGGPASFDRVQDKLKEVAAFLDTLQMAKERGLPSPMGDVLDKLKQVGKEQPAPLGDMLKNLSSNGVSLASGNEYERLNDLWRANVVSLCHKALDDRYPLYAQSSMDVTQDDFAHLLGPDGLINTFFQNKLLSYADTTTDPWQWRSSAQMLHMSPDTLREFQFASIIRDAFFPNGGKTMSVRFELLPLLMDASITRFTLKLNDHVLDYAHGPRRSVSFQWPGGDGAQTVRIDYESEPVGDHDGRSGFGINGPWALFRLLDKAALKPIQADRFNLTLALENKQVALELDANSVVNPFMVPELRQFRCFDQL